MKSHMFILEVEFTGIGGGLDKEDRERGTRHLDFWLCMCHLTVCIFPSIIKLLKNFMGLFKTKCLVLF